MVARCIDSDFLIASAVAAFVARVKIVYSSMRFAQCLVRYPLLRCSEQFKDVALTVIDMNTSIGLTQQGGGSTQILDPAKAFLPFNGQGWR
jgi:hypothetical protein